MTSRVQTSNPAANGRAMAGLAAVARLHEGDVQLTVAGRLAAVIAAITSDERVETSTCE